MRNKIIIIALILLFIILFLSYNKYNKEGLENNKNEYLDGIDVIYWINLDRSTDRRKRMETMFKDPVFEGKKIIRVQAVDGKAADIDKILNSNFTGIDLNRFAKTEYACTLSHLNAIKQFAESNDEVALIMEDDMTLEYKPYWKQTTKQIMGNAPKDWEIIQLCLILNEKSNEIPKYMYTRNPKEYTTWSAGAYIINKKGTNHFLKSKYDMSKKELHVADYYIYNNSVTYSYRYPLFTYVYDENSTMHQDHVEYHNVSKKIIDNCIKK